MFCNAFMKIHDPAFCPTQGFSQDTKYLIWINICLPINLVGRYWLRRTLLVVSKVYIAFIFSFCLISIQNSDSIRKANYYLAQISISMRRIDGYEVSATRMRARGRFDVIVEVVVSQMTETDSDTCKTNTDMNFPLFRGPILLRIK